jgi:hypothetical protein
MNIRRGPNWGLIIGLVFCLAVWTTLAWVFLGAALKAR